MDIRTATQQINAILQQLEQSTGSIVEEISLKRIDVTSFGNRSRVLLTTVEIELKRMPAQNWSV